MSKDDILKALDVVKSFVAANDDDDVVISVSFYASGVEVLLRNDAFDKLIVRDDSVVTYNQVKSVSGVSRRVWFCSGTSLKYPGLLFNTNREVPGEIGKDN